MTVTVLDGGMGGELADRYGSSDGLWSAQLLLDKPEAVVQLHGEFIQAGARMIITNTYSTIPSYLGKAGREAEYPALTRLGGRLARQAADESGEAVTVLGSLPPLEESYRPDLVPPAEAAAPIYRQLAEALAPSVDAFICETMSTAGEALNAATQALAHGDGKPVYVSWTLDEQPGAGLRSGESIPAAHAKLADLPIAGYLFNCTTPEAILAGLKTLRPLTDKPIGCYANRVAKVSKFWTLDNNKPTQRRTDLTQDYFVQTCLDAAAAGATIIGGCCGIAPPYIAALSQALTPR